MFKRATFLLTSGAVFLAACGDSVTAPADQLSEEDIQFLAQEVDATIMGLLDGFFSSSTALPDRAPALTHEPLVWTYAFERSRSCHDGGTVAVAGSGTRTWDRAARTYDVESSGTKTRTHCAFTRDDVVITLNGSGTWTHERHYQDHAPTGIWITTYAGSFDWSKSSGESGSCDYHLTATVDTAANTRTLVGTYCGKEINNSRTWRDA